MATLFNRNSLRIKIISLIIVIFSLIVFSFSFSLNNLITNIEQDLGKKMVLEHANINRLKALSHFKQNLNLIKRSVNDYSFQGWMKDTSNDKFEKKAIKTIKNDCEISDCYGWFVLSVSSLTSLDWNQEDNEIKKVKLKLEENAWLPEKLKGTKEFYVAAGINSIDGNRYVFFDYFAREKGKIIGTVGNYTRTSTIADEILKASNQDVLEVLIDDQGVFHTSINSRDTAHHRKVSTFLQDKSWNDILGTVIDQEAFKSSHNNSVKTIDITINNINYIAAIAYIEEVDWFAMSLLSKKSMKDRIDVIPLFLVILLTLVTIIIFTIYLFNTFIFKRIINMDKAVNNIASGDYNRLIVDSSSDELGSLAQGINTMSQEISKNLSRIESQNTVLSEAIKTTNQAIQAKSNFLANMSHEIRTPLNAVLGFAEIGKKADLLDEKNDCLEKIHFSGEHLLQIINDVLDFSKIGSKQLKLENISFDFSSTFEKITQILNFSIENKGLTLNIHLDDTIPSHLIGDPLRVEQIIINLVSNAIKFTEVGSIEINASLKNRTDEKVRIELCVKDSGIGMTQEQQKNLFTAFSQADDSITRKYGGTGLGLAICKQLAEMMGGSITVESEYGKGTQFIFTVPLTYSTKELQRDTKQTINVDLSTLIKHLHNKTILLVEDNRINQLVATKTLEPLNVSIDIAEDGLQAIEKMRTNSYAFVFMDIQMPKLDGLQATEQIRAFDNETIIIGVSAHASTQNHENAINVGMTDYMTKPIQQALVFEMINKYLFKIN
jgi:signal transduction histidine kinase/CheY-like chemotaxis protein